MSAAVELAERGLLPEPVLRWGIRRLLSGRLRMANEQMRTLLAMSMF